MRTKYLYNGKEYFYDRELRKAIFENERMAYGEPKTTEEFKAIGLDVEVIEYEPTYVVSAEQKRRQMKQEVQFMLDEKAQEFDYDSILSVCSYVDTGCTKFDDEGKAFRSWRSEVWAALNPNIDAVAESDKDALTRDELAAFMPELIVTYTAE